MIRKEDGAIILGNLAITPSLTKADFLTYEAATGAAVYVNNGRWVSYKLPKVAYAGYPVTVVVFFEDQNLTSVHLSCSLPGDGPSWNDWSAEKERERKTVHDTLLAGGLGPPPYSFTRGTVVSVFDEKAGCSYVSLRYSAKAQLCRRGKSPH